jgi:disulfide bond formation protein DsbB
MAGFLIFVIIAIIALNIALLVWVARDSKSRGMDSSVLWMVLVMVTGVIGLVIYLFARPQGNIIPCPQCGNKRLQVSAKCPHCGNA